MIIASNYIFTGEHLLKNAYIKIDSNGNILFVSEENKLENEKERMLFYNGIVSPAFINSHCHIELSALQNKVELNSGLTAFIKSISQLKKTKQHLDLNKIKQADDFMYKNGIQAVGDVANDLISVEVKKESKIYYHNFIEMYSIDDRNFKNIIEYGNLLSNKYIEHKLKYSFAPHSFYSVTEKLINFITTKEQDVLSVHFLESKQEKDFFQNHTGLLYDYIININRQYNPLVSNVSGLMTYLFKLKKKNKSIILVHNVELDNKELFQDENIFLCLCPNSNINIHNKLPKKELLNNNYNFTIGTDSLASNDKLCMLEEMRTLMNNYNNLRMIDVLRWATYNGAKALGIDDKFGKIEKNYNPGILYLGNIDLQNLKFKDNSFIERII